MPRKTLAGISTLALALSLGVSALAASVPVDLSDWWTHDQPTAGAFASPGSWSIDDSGTVVVQEENGRPTFFVAPGDITGHRFSATLSSPGPDNDFFGVALGFSTGVDADFLLIDWRRSIQPIDWQDGVGPVTGVPGLAVSRVDGLPTMSELWAHIDSPVNSNGGVEELGRGTTFGEVGWTPGTPYEFVVEYTEDSLQVWVNGSQEISITGAFPSGPVALYDFSEPGLTISGISIETLNDPPTVLEGGAADVVVAEGQIGTTSGAFTDPDGDPLRLTCTGGCGGFSDTGGGTWSWSQLLREGPAGRSVSITASDGEYSATDTFRVRVDNVAPEITGTGSGLAMPEKHDIGLELEALVTFIDVGVLDTHTARFSWGDGTSSVGVVTETDGSGSASAGHRYSEPGFYTVSVTVWDDDGGHDSAVLGEVFVFDPDTFVTGGGWVASPEGAWVDSPSTEGKGTFGFVARYDRSGEVRGNLEFQLHKGIRLHARSFDYLLVNDGIARFSGTGSVNGESGYDFEVVVTDERHSGSAEDLFWITIAGPSGIVYDGDAYPPKGLPIVGRGIQIHDKG